MSEPPKPGADPQATETPEPPSRAFNQKMLGFFADAALPESDAPPLERDINAGLGSPEGAPSADEGASFPQEPPPRIQAPLPTAVATSQPSRLPLVLGLFLVLLAVGAAAVFFLKK